MHSPAFQARAVREISFVFAINTSNRSHCWLILSFTSRARGIWYVLSQPRQKAARSTVFRIVVSHLHLSLILRTSFETEVVGFRQLMAESNIRSIFEEPCFSLNGSEADFDDSPIAVNEFPSIGFEQEPQKVQAESTITRQHQFKKDSWKKPSDMPKRPMSAYNLFFQLERERLINGQAARVFTVEDVDRIAALQKVKDMTPKPKRLHRKSHGKISFGELARVIANKWKALNTTSRAVFVERAAIEKIQYKIAIEAWSQTKRHPKPNSVSNQTSKHLSGIWLKPVESQVPCSDHPLSNESCRDDRYIMKPLQPSPPQALAKLIDHRVLLEESRRKQSMRIHRRNEVSSPEVPLQTAEPRVDCSWESYISSCIEEKISSFMDQISQHEHVRVSRHLHARSGPGSPSPNITSLRRDMDVVIPMSLPSSRQTSDHTKGSLDTFPRQSPDNGFVEGCTCNTMDPIHYNEQVRMSQHLQSQSDPDFPPPVGDDIEMVHQMAHHSSSGQIMIAQHTAVPSVIYPQQLWNRNFVHGSTFNVTDQINDNAQVRIPQYQRSQSVFEFPPPIVDSVVDNTRMAYPIRLDASDQMSANSYAMEGFFTQNKLPEMVSKMQQPLTSTLEQSFGAGMVHTVSHTRQAYSSQILNTSAGNCLISKQMREEYPQRQEEYSQSCTSPFQMSNYSQPVEAYSCSQRIQQASQYIPTDASTDHPYVMMPTSSQPRQFGIHGVEGQPTYLANQHSETNGDTQQLPFFEEPLGSEVAEDDSLIWTF
jgi:hypothetical protein